MTEEEQLEHSCIRWYACKTPSGSYRPVGLPGFSGKGVGGSSGRLSCKMIQGFKTISHFFPFCQQFIQNLSIGFLMYCEGEPQPPDGCGLKAFQRPLPSRAVCFHTSPHRPGSRKRSDIPYPLPSADCFHCIFPEGGR